MERIDKDEMLDDLIAYHEAEIGQQDKAVKADLAYMKRLPTDMWRPHLVTAIQRVSVAQKRIAYHRKAISFLKGIREELT